MGSIWCLTKLSRKPVCRMRSLCKLCFDWILCVWATGHGSGIWGGRSPLGRRPKNGGIATLSPKHVVFWAKVAPFRIFLVENSLFEATIGMFRQQTSLFGKNRSFFGIFQNIFSSPRNFRRVAFFLVFWGGVAPQYPPHASVHMCLSPWFHIFWVVRETPKHYLPMPMCHLANQSYVVWWLIYVSNHVIYLYIIIIPNLPYC